MNLEQDRESIREALGSGDEDQQRIAEVGVAVIALLLRKNADYGSSAWRSPMLKQSLVAGDAILVRMSDKIERIASLGQRPGRVVEESLEDTMRDLCGYALLWLAKPGPGKGSESC